MRIFPRLRLDQIQGQVEAVVAEEVELHTQAVLQDVYATLGGPSIDIHSGPGPITKTITSLGSAVADIVHPLGHGLLQSRVGQVGCRLWEIGHGKGRKNTCQRRDLETGLLGQCTRAFPMVPYLSVSWSECW